MQEGMILKGIMFKKIYHNVLFNQSKNFLNRPNVCET
jgi:hypothetical protein